jgi:hypothetical protein
MRFLFCLNQSSRLFLAKHLSRLKQTKWSYQDVSQGLRNFDGDLSTFFLEEKKYLFGGRTKEEVAIECDTTIPLGDRAERMSYLEN